MRVMVGPFGDLLDSWQQVLVLISIATMVLGAFAAIVQTNFKRLMAYSSIGHMGYALIGIAVGNEAGITGVMVYLAAYIFMNIEIFAIILALRREGRLFRSEENTSDIQSLMRLSYAVLCFNT